jgi:uncharacterized lipoprotein
VKIFKKSLIFISVLGLTACSSFGYRYGFLKDETQTYKKLPPIERTVVIPQNLSPRSVQDYYEVPQPAPDAPNVEPSLAPPSSSLSATPVPGNMPFEQKIRDAEKAKIQGHTRAAAARPAPVAINYSQAWVKVSHVLRATGYKIVEKDNSMGTYYVIDTSSTGGKVKRDMPIYQVNLKSAGNGTVVAVSPANARLETRLKQSLSD